MNGESMSLLTGQKARSKLLVGINKLANTVKGTFGPQARMVIIQNPMGMPIILNDGVTIARAVHDKDPYVQLGIDLMKEVACEAQEKSGDGTTGAALIAQTLCNGSLSLMEKGVSPLAIRDELKEYLNQTKKYLLDEAILYGADSEWNLEDVAMIASNNDDELGTLIADLVEAGGPSGAIVIEKSPTSETFTKHSSGMEINAGFAHVLMANTPKKRCEFDNPLVLTTTERIESFNTLVPALEIAVKQNKPLVIFCADFNLNMLQNLLVNIVQGKVSVCIVKPTGMPEQQQGWLEDIRCVVGSKLFSTSLSESIVKVSEDDLGSCDNFYSSSTTTTLSVKLNKQKLPFDRRTKTTPYYMEEHIEWLKSMIESEENSWLKEQYSNRLSRITSGISTIYVGGASEVEQIERKERVDDAVNACKSALESGVVVGGGATLYGAIDYIAKFHRDDDIFNLFCDALATPLKTIIGNSGQAGDLGDCRPNGYKLPKKSYFCGKTGHILKASEGGVYDPVMVVINSLESAVSIAALVLMTDAAIIAPDA